MLIYMQGLQHRFDHLRSSYRELGVKYDVPIVQKEHFDIKNFTYVNDLGDLWRAALQGREV
jgi:hypothetical protein